MMNENNLYTLENYIQECKQFEKKYGLDIKYIWAGVKVKAE